MGLHISFHDPIKFIKSCPLSAEALQYLGIPSRGKKSKLLSMVYKVRCHLTPTLTMFLLPDYDYPGLLSFSFGGQCLMSQETTEETYALCPFCLLSEMLLPCIWGWLPPSHHSQMSLSQRPFLTTLILSSPIPLLNLSHHFFQRPSVQFQFSRSVVSDSLQPHGL